MQETRAHALTCTILTGKAAAISPASELHHPPFSDSHAVANRVRSPLKSDDESGATGVHDPPRPFPLPAGRSKADAPPRLNNDLTNMLSCISPFHPKASTPFSSAMLHAATTETAGYVSEQLLAPGLCNQPWYNSKLMPKQAYREWFNNTFHPTESLTDPYEN